MVVESSLLETVAVSVHVNKLWVYWESSVWPWSRSGSASTTGYICIFLVLKMSFCFVLGFFEGKCILTKLRTFWEVWKTGIHVFGATFPEWLCTSWLFFLFPPFFLKKTNHFIPFFLPFFHLFSLSKLQGNLTVIDFCQFILFPGFRLYYYYYYCYYHYIIDISDTRLLWVCV